MTEHRKQFNQSIIKPLAVLLGVGFVTVLVIKSNVFCSQASAFCGHQAEVELSSSEIEPQYFTFSPAKLTTSLSENKTVVLYFHAPWCTTCTTFDQELRGPDTHLPSDVVVLQIDYDSATALKSQYSVTYQHTLVLLDPQGNTKEMWIGGDLRSLLDYLKKNS